MSRFLKVPKRFPIHPAWVVGIYFGAALLMMVGCGEVDKVNDSLGQMSNMNSKMSSMSTDTSAVSSDSCILYDNLRQSQAVGSRTPSEDHLIDAQDEAEKIKEAGIYFMAFDFQLWSNACLDNSLINHDLLFQDATQEFTQTLPQFFPDQTDLSVDPSAISDGDPKSKANLQATFNALAASLHLLNSKQAQHKATDPSFLEVSMLDLLEQGLAAKPMIDSGKATMASFPPHVEQVLLQERYVVALLQARYNIAPAIVLNAISNVNNGFFDKLEMYFLHWKPDLSRLNMVQLQDYQTYIQGAIDVRNFLLKYGYKPEINSQFKKVLRNMEYNSDPTIAKDIGEQRDKLVKMIQDYANEK